MAGHVVAGSLAALSVVSLVLYLRSERWETPPVRGTVVPLQGGLAAGLGWTF